MTDWDRFAAQLAEQLSVLPAGAMVKVVASSPPYRFAQFAQGDAYLLAELTGDEYLPPTDRPAEDRRRRIIDAGWQVPDLDHGGNWWIEVPWPVASAIYRQLAAMVVTGLRDGLAVGSPAGLCYEAWNAQASNELMDLPLLGLYRIDSR
ncbi:hypothetical protein ACFYTQ_36740 [Nocardia sp. NPDC004068]|uniref:TY-Chap domain-containing protein n=1 Tax=Nocardia sp. NPDC004068 TaxID=3364303 RepID=UPI00369A59F5